MSGIIESDDEALKDSVEENPSFKAQNLDWPALSFIYSKQEEIDFLQVYWRSELIYDAMNTTLRCNFGVNLWMIVYLISNTEILLNE